MCQKKFGRTPLRGETGKKPRKLIWQKIFWLPTGSETSPNISKFESKLADRTFKRLKTKRWIIPFREFVSSNEKLKSGSSLKFSVCEGDKLVGGRVVRLCSDRQCSESELQTLHNKEKILKLKGEKFSSIGNSIWPLLNSRWSWMPILPRQQKAFPPKFR